MSVMAMGLKPLIASSPDPKVRWGDGLSLLASRRAMGVIGCGITCHSGHLLCWVHCVFEQEQYKHVGPNPVGCGRTWCDMVVRHEAVWHEEVWHDDSVAWGDVVQGGTVWGGTCTTQCNVKHVAVQHEEMWCEAMRQILCR